MLVRWCTEESLTKRVRNQQVGTRHFPLDNIEKKVDLFHFPSFILFLPVRRESMRWKKPLCSLENEKEKKVVRFYCIFLGKNNGTFFSLSFLPSFLPLLPFKSLSSAPSLFPAPCPNPEGNGDGDELEGRTRSFITCC